MDEPFDATALAAQVGITREVFPEFFGCQRCRLSIPNEHECGYCLENGSQPIACNLPDPMSDDPRAVLWEPFFMRALGWHVSAKIVVVCLGNKGDFTATLYAAQKAKEATNEE